MQEPLVEALVSSESRRSTSSQFLRVGNVLRIVASTDLESHIPVGVYSVGSDRDGFYLEVSDSFQHPGKVYGDPTKLVERFLHTFRDRQCNTGVLLAGEKGSGKSLTAKLLSIKAAEAGIPTLLINSPHCGEAFNEFFSEIKQPVVAIFDEFEKVYDYDQQKQLLTLLDGVRPSNKLFVFTTNEHNNIEYHLNNRPGRIFYGIKYLGLDEAFIREYLADNLKNKAEINKTVQVCKLVGKLNFDTLACLVQEMNRYDETAKEAIRLMNVSTEAKTTNFKVKLEVDGEVVSNIHPKVITNPLGGEDDDPITIYNMDVDEARTRGRRQEFEFERGHFMSVDPEGTITYYNAEDKATLTCTPKHSSPVSLYSTISRYESC